MPDTCIKKFKVAVEVANFVCYVKYVSKEEENTVKKLVDTLYDFISSKNSVTKKEIENIIHLHRNHLSPSMFKEDKFSLPYNPINNKYLTSFDTISDTYEAQFVIKTNTNIESHFNKYEFMNQFTDLKQNSYYLLDIRYYGMEKKYYEVDFELHLTEKGLYLSCDDDKIIKKFLEQYDLKQVCEILEIKKDVDYHHYLDEKDILKDHITELFPFNNNSLLEQLVECYEVGNSVFINNVFLNTVNLDFKDLIKPLEKPKLIVVLEKQDYSYFNQHNNRVNRIEDIDNNIIVYVDEHLFREAIGNMNYLLIVNENYMMTLNKLSKEFGDLVYLAKGENKSLSIFKNILEKYFSIKKLTSYIDNLSLLIFVLGEEEVNSSLNYYLVNTLKSNGSLLRFNVESREQLPFSELKKLVNVYYVAKELNKNIVLNPNSISLILNDMLSMIKRIDTIEKLIEFNDVMQEIINIFKIDVNSHEVEINKIVTLLEIKKAMFEKETPISFILDTSVLMDEPDIFHKYFNNNSIIVHSVIRDELEYFRGNNINAVRAMRNINYLKNNPKAHLEYIDGEKPSTEFTKLYKVKVFENLIDRLNSEGRYPVIVSNDAELVLQKKKKGSVIELDHIPLLFH